MDNDDYMFVDSCNGLDELISVVPGIKVISVSSISLNCDIPKMCVNKKAIASWNVQNSSPFACIGIDEYNGSLGRSCSGCSIGSAIGGTLNNLCAVLLGLNLDCVEGRDEILSL